jgi:hypothetical protein
MYKVLKYFFNSNSGGGGVQSNWVHLAPSATNWPTVPAPEDYEDGEYCEVMIGRGNRSSRRKPAPSDALSTTNPT